MHYEVKLANISMLLGASRMYSWVESRVDERSTPCLVSSRRSRCRVKSQVKSIYNPRCSRHFKALLILVKYQCDDVRARLNVNCHRQNLRIIVSIYGHTSNFYTIRHVSRKCKLFKSESWLSRVQLQVIQISDSSLWLKWTRLTNTDLILEEDDQVLIVAGETVVDVVGKHISAGGVAGQAGWELV